MRYFDDLVIKVPHSLGNRKQPEDGLKWAETCSCGIYVHFVHKFCCILTDKYTLYLFIEHNRDVTLRVKFSWFFSACGGKFRDSTVKRARYSPVIRHYLTAQYLQYCTWTQDEYLDVDRNRCCFNHGDTEFNFRLWYGPF